MPVHQTNGPQIKSNLTNLATGMLLESQWDSMGSHWDPFWELWEHFWSYFAGSDFRSILGCFGQGPAAGAGGRGGVPGTLESE